MNNKVASLLIGIFLCGGILLAIVLIVARPDAVSPAPQETVLTSSDLEKAQDLSTGTQNFGDLPYQVGSDQIGRDNPFESY